MSKPHDNLVALGTGSTKYNYDTPDFAVLEKFPSPFNSAAKKGVLDIRGHLDIVCPEFTSLCPVTGQPDFATIKIHYIPDDWCVESKSLKLYLMGFRNHGEFHESCVQQICSDLVVLLAPFLISVTGEFTPRGGIPFWPTATWRKKSKTQVPK